MGEQAMDPRWSAVDAFFESCVVGPDAALEGALARSRGAGLAAIDVTPCQGKLLHVLALLCGARRVLEVGTLGGYSTIWLARAVGEGGRVVTLEIDPRCAAVARGNLEAAGVGGRVEVRVGPAAASLERLRAAGEGPFDLVFVDADKENGPAYYEAVVPMTRAGGLVIVDNVVRDGLVADASCADPRVVGSREVVRRMGADPRVVATAIQTVGSKGYDGLAVARVVGA